MVDLSLIILNYCQEQRSKGRARNVRHKIITACLTIFARINP
jgi:hypothetical protein